MHHDNSFICIFALFSPYKLLITMNKFFQRKTCSHKSCTIFCTDGSTRVTGWERYVLGLVCHLRSALEGVALSGVHGAASLLLVTGVLEGQS